MENKQTIKSNVSNCKNYDENEEKCNLDEIKVSCNCDGCDCENKDETICENFEEK